MASKYDVALSFAGEDRAYVRQVAQILKDNEITVFYDEFEEDELWGKDLGVHLAKVYGGGIAKYCIPFISKYYAEKAWTNHEIKNALSQAIDTKEDYILPARFDHTEIEGIRKSISYINLSKRSPQQFAELIIKKLGRQVVTKEEAPKTFMPYSGVTLSVQKIVFNDGRHFWPPAALTVTIVNLYKEPRYFKAPIFGLDNPIDGNDTFVMIDTLQDVEFPKRLEPGEPVEVTYTFRPGAVEAWDEIAPAESEFYAIVYLTTGEEIVSNKRKISEVRNALRNL